MTRKVSDLGEVGVADQGILRPWVLVLFRGGKIWDLTGYVTPTLKVWDYRTKVPVAITGALTISDDAAGEVTYTPAVGDPIFATSGLFEARASAIPGTGDPESSGLFRYSIGIKGTVATP